MSASRYGAEVLRTSDDIVGDKVNTTASNARVSSVVTSRYAIYYAPSPATQLWTFGSSILGYDAASGVDVACPDMPVAGPDWHAWTAEPRRYGFHGTLKAPFALAKGVSEDDLLRAAVVFASGRSVFAAPPLHVATIGAFVALVPAEASPPLDDLAAACVRAFDRFRAPLTPHDRERRLRASLSGRHILNLDRWGYPHVFEDFRFHMTLTGALHDSVRAPVRTVLEERYRDLTPDTLIDAISIFRQQDPASRFRILARYPFGG